MGNQHHKVLDSLDIPISILGVKISYTFNILDKFWHAIILGIYFLYYHNVQVDLDRKTFYIQDKLVSACFVCS